MGRDVSRHRLEGLLREVAEHEGCLLAHLLADLRRSDSSTKREADLVCAIERLLARGYTLRSHVPPVPASVQEEWLGRRWVLAHSRWLTSRASWTSVVSSRLGRYGRLLADWPVIIELQLRWICRTGSLYLAVPGTSVAALVAPLLARGAVPALRVRLPEPDDHDVAAWLADRLHSLAASEAHLDDDLHLSPALSGSASGFAVWPLQDRVAVCWASRVRGLRVRAGGAIAHLLERRLADSRFSTGSVSVLLPGAREHTASARGIPASVRSTQLDWLARGAVGWYLPPRQPQSPLPGCRMRVRRDNEPRWQLTSSYELSCSGLVPPENGRLDDQRLTGELPRYLVHCVRGLPGVLPPDEAQDWIAQMWHRGRMPDESPLARLVDIVESAVVRGRAALNRTDRPSVSFSGVPLDELVARRSFQPHLGRWDWEPFGLMIERQALEHLGARPVIYGAAATYERLSLDDRPYFQPGGRRQRCSPQRRDWQDECEWRVVGDVRLNDLPRWSVHLFVAYAHQAQALARHSPWPIIWLQDAQTHAGPAGSKCRPRRAARTNKS